MSRWISALLSLAVAPSASAWTLDFRKELASLPGGAEFSEREATRDGRTVRIHAVIFREKSFRLAVIDNPSANQGKLADAMTASGAIAGINGGYFHEDWRPVGLAIANGVTSNGFERAKLLSGVFAVTGGRPRIVRSAAYEASKNDTDALQAGPFLIDNGQPTSGLNSERRARRTVLATDGKGLWAIFVFSSVTLADTARLLADPAIFPDFRPQSALNLDGGSSSALWVATSPRPFVLPEIGSVRNYLAIIPR